MSLPVARYRLRTRHGTIPLSSGFIILLSLLFCLLFILSVCLVFVNSDAGNVFLKTLDNVSAANPGVSTDCFHHNG